MHTFASPVTYIYGTAQFKLDTRMQRLVYVHRVLQSHTSTLMCLVTAHNLLTSDSVCRTSMRVNAQISLQGYV